MHNSGNSIGVGGSSATNNSSTTYGMTPEQASREFDVLRREATKLERHLEDRVARYQQVSFICNTILVFCVFDIIYRFFYIIYQRKRYNMGMLSFCSFI